MKNQINKNECNRKEDLITYLYGEATPAEEKAFKQHLQECSSCKKETAEFGIVRQSLQTWQAPEAPQVALDLPVERPRSLREILRELGSVLPAWFKFGTGFAAAGAFSLLLLAVFNTQVHYDKNGFSFQAALFSSKQPSVQTLKSGNSNADELIQALVAKALSEKDAQINQVLEEKRAQIEKELRKQIDILSSEISEKSNTEISKATLELKRKQQTELEKALQQIQNQGTKQVSSDDDDPFNLWGGVDDKVLQKAFENREGSSSLGN